MSVLLRKLHRGIALNMDVDKKESNKYSLIEYIQKCRYLRLLSSYIRTTKAFPPNQAVVKLEKPRCKILL